MLVLLTFGGGGGAVVQNRESPDFRSPEAGRYAIVIFVFIPSPAVRSILKPNVMSWFSLSLHQSFVDCLNCFIFLLLGNKWNLKKFVPYSEMLESISQKWPNIERLSDHPNDTSKVFVQISL